MKKLAAVLVSLALTAPVAGATAASGAPAKQAYIVVLRGGSGVAHAAEHGIAPTNVYGSALRGYAAKLSTAEVRRLRADRRVLFVTRSHRFTVGDPKVTFGRLQDQVLPTGIDRVDADRSATADIDGRGGRVDVDVAILDTGVDVDHPDLNVAGGVNCTSPPAHRSVFDDRNGHGTHVAGTVAALDNGIGVVGVAPGARIWSVRVLNAGGLGSDAEIICGIDWITARADRIEVANMSFGGPGLPDDGNCGRDVGDALHLAICRSVAAGVTYTAAAGNTPDDIDELGFAPASYDEVITVSALADFDGRPGGDGEPTCRDDEDDTFANFSSFGADVDVIAPGVCILSTFPRNRQLGSKSGYGTISGTSMSTPHATGAAALYLATHPSTSPAQVRAALRAAGNLGWDADDDGDGVKEKLVNVATF
jgi:subtilisin family serine protease